MGDKDMFSISKIEEYVKKFGGADRFFKKILSSFNFSFSIINAYNYEVEVSNLDSFEPGVKCYKLYYDKDFVCDECPIERIVEGKEKASVEMDSSDFFFYPIFGEGGKVVSVIKYGIKGKEIIREVVKEVVVDCGHKDYEESFYNILQNSQDLVYRYDFRKNCFEYVSESVFVLTGFSLGEFVKMSYNDFLDRVHPDDFGETCDIRSSEGEVVCEGVYRWKCKDGKYRWFSDRKTWFFDANDNRECVIGDMKDVTEDKEREIERIELEDRIALMKKKEMSAGDRVGLTDKEKLVFWGLCRWPLMNDEELAGKLDLKRSTLTAIRNRLRGKDLFSLRYVPNFSKLGCQFFGVFDGKTGGGKIRKLNLDVLKEIPEVVLNNYQDEKFFGVFVSDKYVEFRKFLEKFEEENKEALRFGFSETSLFFDLEDFELRDFSGVISSLFNIDVKGKPEIYNFKGTFEPLNINEKRVLHMMVRDPEMSSSEVAKKVWVSKPTVIKIKNRLIEDGIVYALVVPNFRRLGLEYFARLTYEFDSDLDFENKKRGDVSRTVLRVNGKRKVVKFVLFMNENEYLEEVDLIKESYRRSGVSFRLDSEIFPIQKRGKNNFDLDLFVGEFLFRDAE